MKKVFLLMIVACFTQECLLEWEKIIESQNSASPNSESSLMLLYSGILPNNLGNFESCNKLDQAKYTVFKIHEIPLVVITVCGPKVCTKEDYYNLDIPILQKTASKPIDIIFPNDYQNDHYDTYSTGAVFMIIFIAILVAIGILASIFDYFLSDSAKSLTLTKCLLCFSIIKNSKDILTIESEGDSGEKDPILLLDGVKVMCIGWIIMAYTCLHYVLLPAINNFDTALFDIKDSNYILVYGALHAIDTAYWMSGFLMTYYLLKQIEISSGISSGKIVLFYLYKYLEITPLVMFCTFFFWNLEEYIGNGPLWYNTKELIGNCEDYWYINFFYLGNFIPDWEGSTCLFCTWLIDVEMQLLLFCPIILEIYLRVSKTLCWIILTILCFLSIIIDAIVAHHYELNPAILAKQNDNGNNYFYHYINKPYTWMATFAFGMICGIIIFTYRKYKNTSVIFDDIALYIAKSQENAYVRGFTFLCGLALINIMIFLPYDLYKDPGDDFEFDNWSQTANETFIAFERFAYGLGLSMIFLPMLLGHFRLFSGFLSLYPWLVLSKFMIGVYMICLSVIQISLASQKTVLRFYEYYNIRDTIFFFILSSFFAIPLVFLVQLPTTNLLQLLFYQSLHEERNKPDDEESLLNTNKEQKYFKEQP